MRNAASILLIGLILYSTSCVTSKRCFEKFPPRPEIDTVFSDTTIFRDTILYDTVFADTIFSEVSIEIPQDIFSDTASAETEFAFAEAFVWQKNLILNLYQKDSLLKYRLDSAISVNKKEVIITEKIPYEIQLPPKPFFKIGFFIVAAILVLMIAGLILRK